MLRTFCAAVEEDERWEEEEEGESEEGGRGLRRRKRKRRKEEGRGEMYLSLYQPCLALIKRSPRLFS